jgi:hypothetical protein
MTQIGQELDYIARMQSSLYTKKRQNRQKNVALEPYNTPPEGNAPFNYFNGTPGVGQTGNTVIPSSFRVPNGWDGIIDAIVTRYTGTNFTEASGDLTWAIRVDGAYVMGYENIRVSLGDLSGGWRIRPGIIIKSGQLVEMVTIVSGTFVPQTNSVILGAMAGYFYPNGIARTN